MFNLEFHLSNAALLIGLAALFAISLYLYYFMNRKYFNGGGNEDDHTTPSSYDIYQQDLINFNNASANQDVIDQLKSDFGDN